VTPQENTLVGHGRHLAQVLLYRSVDLLVALCLNSAYPPFATSVSANPQADKLQRDLLRYRFLLGIPLFRQFTGEIIASLKAAEARSRHVW
jgi:hypothetical protein